MNILITSGSRKITLIRAFQQALQQAGPGKVIAVDVSPYAPGLYLADDHYLVPASNSPGFLAHLLDLCDRQQVKLLVPTRDEELPLFAAHAQEFAAVGTHVMVSSPATISLCQDKKQFISFCQANGFAVPKVHADLTTDLVFPVFVKPRFGKGGAHATRVDSPEELAYALCTVPEPIVQEFIWAPEYTIDLFCDFAGQVLSVVPRERISVVGGESYVGKTVRNTALIDAASRLAISLGLLGHNTIQCFLAGDAVRFIEVNPRFGGGAHLGFAAGVLTPLLLVKLLKGEPIEPGLLAFKANYVMLRYTEDIFVDEDKLTGKRFA